MCAVFALALSALAEPARFVTAPIAVKEQPAVEIIVNGKTVPCMVDTGSAVPLVLFSKSFPDLAKRADGKGEVAVDARGAAKGELCARRARFIDASHPGIHGIIGWPALQNSIWRLDLPNQRHQFLTALPPECADWTAFPIAAKRKSLAIEHPDLGEIFIDSGAMRGVCFSSSRWKTWRNQHPGRPLTLAEGFSPAAAGGVFANEVAHHVDFPLGKFTLRDTNVGATFFDPGTDGASLLIGLEGWKRTTLIIDGPHRRVYFRETKAGKWQASPPNRLQAAFLPDGRTQALLAQVIDQGSAHQQGLRTGDRLTGIDRDLDPPSFDRMKDFARKRGAKATLTVMRNGQALRIPITVP